MIRTSKPKNKEKCEVNPLGWFGNYKGLSGCTWCKSSKECKKETEKKSNEK